MSANSYNDLRAHIGHKIACACYGTKIEHPDNVVIECEDCSTVLMSFDKPEDSTVELYSPEALAAKYDSKENDWGYHPYFTIDDWQESAGQGNTLQGYWEWVSHQIECLNDDINNIPAEELALHINDEELGFECPEVKEYFNNKLAACIETQKVVNFGKRQMKKIKKAEGEQHV